MMYSLISPRLNPITCAVMMACMKELDPLFPEDKLQLLDEGFENGLKEILVRSQAVFPQQLEKMTRVHLARIGAVYGYMANRSKDIRLPKYVSDLT